MKSELRKDMIFTLYIVTVLILSIIYFTVPERKEFFEFQFRWWGEFRDVIAYLFP